MTFTQIVENINHTPRAKFTDFLFEDDFYLCSPVPCTKRTARKRYEEARGHKAPKIEQAFFMVTE